MADVNGLDSRYWDSIVEFSSSVEPPPFKIPFGKFRATFILTKDEIQKLKDYFVFETRRRGSVIRRLSSFTVACSLVWVCLAKSEAAAPGGEEVSDDEPEYLAFSADCRGRLNPPLPASYFGNCVAIMKAEMKHGELKQGIDGFVKAVDSIGKVIEENVFNNERGVLHGAEYWGEEYRKLAGKRQHGVVGSPRFDFYTVDYGWGSGAKKFEALFIDSGGAFSLCKSREYEGGLEIGLSKPKPQLDAFSTASKQLLNNLFLQY